MKRGRTDSAESISSEEFHWGEAGLTEAHGYILGPVRSMLSRLKPQSVLDLGCGNGAFTRAISGEGIRVTGLDSSASGIGLARGQGMGVEFVGHSLHERLPEGLVGRFEVVVAVEVIEHLFRPRDLLDRVREALVPGGHLILTTPYHGYLKNLALALTDGFDAHWHPLRDHGHVKFFSRRTLTRLLVEEGFEVGEFLRLGRIPPLACSMLICARMSSVRA